MEEVLLTARATVVSNNLSWMRLWWHCRSQSTGPVVAIDLWDLSFKASVGGEHRQGQKPVQCQAIQGTQGLKQRMTYSILGETIHGVLRYRLAVPQLVVFLQVFVWACFGQKRNIIWKGWSPDRLPTSRQWVVNGNDFVLCHFNTRQEALFVQSLIIINVGLTSEHRDLVMAESWKTCPDTQMSDFLSW